LSEAADAIKGLDRAIARRESDAKMLRDQRRVLRKTLREEGWSYRRIAAISNCTDSAIEKDVNRAR
jgi:DNA-directed RNA polymerase specialized sigma24 family protein